MNLILSILMVLVVHTPWCVYSTDQLRVKMTLVRNSTASNLGAYCLDGSLPGYNLHKGFGAGSRNWLLQFEGGGWCNDIKSCLERSKSDHGSTTLMSNWLVFNGIMSNNASLNPDFYNWNRVRLRYCDGASFAGDSLYRNGTTLLYFRGQKIWEAIIHDLLPQGLANAGKALLSGCSAGGLATFLHCDSFTRYLPQNTSVKCFSDAGLFLDAIDISQNRTMRTFYKSLVSLQGVEKNLDKNCTSSLVDPSLCFFPQYVLKYIQTPFFVLNSAYDTFQFHHSFVPPSADRSGRWARCKNNLTACNPHQIDILQGFRADMLLALRSFYNSTRGGMFIDSCFVHCQSATQNTWLADDSPRIHNKTIAEAVGDWYFSRGIAKEIDYPYPCDKTCPKLILSTGQVNDMNMF